jgi:hypothetical protein
VATAISVVSPVYLAALAISCRAFRVTEPVELLARDLVADRLPTVQIQAGTKPTATDATACDGHGRVGSRRA